jgi:hypothetical protein
MKNSEILICEGSDYLRNSQYANFEYLVNKHFSVLDTQVLLNMIKRLLREDNATRAITLWETTASNYRAYLIRFAAVRLGLFIGIVGLLFGLYIIGR